MQHCGARCKRLRCLLSNTVNSCLSSCETHLLKPSLRQGLPESDPMDGAKLAIHGTGYPLPGGYDAVVGCILCTKNPLATLRSVRIMHPTRILPTSTPCAANKRFSPPPHSKAGRVWSCAIPPLSSAALLPAPSLCRCRYPPAPPVCLPSL